MALSASAKHWLFVASLIYIFCKFGGAYEYDDPQQGAVPGEYVPPAEDEGETGDNFPEAGITGNGAGFLFNKALKCFSDKNIYAECEEAHRLTESGEVHVPPEYTDQYCNGPCLAETHHVLDCIHGIFKSFVFYNKATVKAVRETIESGCSDGPKRGNFNVMEHIQADKASTNKVFDPVVYVSMVMILGWLVFF